MRGTHLLLLADGWDSGSAGSAEPAGLAGLAAALGVGERELVAAIATVLDAGSEPSRVVILAQGEPAVVAAVKLTAAHRGPGAPSVAERYFEAGLKLGAASVGQATLWVAGGEDASAHDALWAGAWLGTQRPAMPLDAERRPLFGDGRAPSTGAELGAVARGWVRDLVERPASALGPRKLGDEILALAAGMGEGVTAELWAAEDAEARGFGALAAVGGGSERPPVVARLRWAGSGSTGPTLGVVGKGVTFDSGGLNVKKDPGELAWMKSDMASAATVAAALVLASRLTEPGAPVEVILPLCDNAVSGSSVRPGDVVTHPDGRTTEVVDTDCEGRLILADGLAWLRSQGAAALVDLGTLTDGGAGLRVAGLWSNDAEFAGRLQGLGGQVPDPLWAIPLPYGEDSVLESRVADAKNAPLDRPDVGRHAATFLAEFVGETPWAHLDIGGVAYLESPIAGWPEGPTGATTLAVAEAMRAWAAGALR